MRPIPLILALIFLATIPALAQDAGATESEETVEDDTPAEEEFVIDPSVPIDAADVTLDQFLWIARPVVVFADTPSDPRFIEQMALLAERPEPLLERDVVVIFDTDPDAESSFRTALRPRGFSLVIVQKDGAVGLRRPSPRDVREIMRAIDNFSLRQEELLNGG